MEIFIKECYGLEDENTQFFFRWYETIIRDFSIFKSILEKYENSSDKEYTKDYNGKFDNSMLYCEIEESEKYYDSLFKQNK